VIASTINLSRINIKILTIETDIRIVQDLGKPRLEKPIPEFFHLLAIA
jgi:hypothetical protein